MTKISEKKVKRNVRLASITAEVSCMLDNYKIEPFKLSEYQEYVIKDLGKYLKLVEETKLYRDNIEKQSIYSFLNKRIIIDGYKALEEIGLIAKTGQEIDSFCKGLQGILQQIKKQEKIQNSDLEKYNKYGDLLWELSELVDQPTYHPEASHDLGSLDND